MVAVKAFKMFFSGVKFCAKFEVVLQNQSLSVVAKKSKEINLHSFD